MSLLEKYKKELELEKRKEEEAKNGLLDAKIVSVEEGRMSDFIDEKVMQKYDMKDTEAVRITVRNDEYNITVVQTFKKSYHAKANFRKFIEQYKDSDTIKIVWDKIAERWKIFIA